MKHIYILTGHYGSGKTEIAVNMALYFITQKRRTALVDLDIANPYFRSRERRELLEERGIEVFSNTFGYEITADFPALSAGIRKPLEEEGTVCVVDAGGNDSGAMVLNQFRGFFRGEGTGIYAVVNANRPDTDDLPKARSMLSSIRAETGLPFAGVINNTHLLRETTPEDVWKGRSLCLEIADELGIPLTANCCEARLARQLAPMERVWPIDLYMRPSWLDL